MLKEGQPIYGDGRLRKRKTTRMEILEVLGYSVYLASVTSHYSHGKVIYDIQPCGICGSVPVDNPNKEYWVVLQDSFCPEHKAEILQTAKDFTKELKKVKNLNEAMKLAVKVYLKIPQIRLARALDSDFDKTLADAGKRFLGL